MPQNPFYVYALKDPRLKPAKPFYIGKGTGNRAWEHQTQIDESEKGVVIQAIHDAGHSVLHTVMADNLTEEQALKLEAELISAFGVRKHGGLLTNHVRPNPNNISKRIRINVPEGCYEKTPNGFGAYKISCNGVGEGQPRGCEKLRCSEISRVAI